MTATRRFVLLGHPVGHSVSPAIHSAAYRALGVSHEYTTVDCPSEQAVVEQVARLRAGELSGANVTVPYKRLALQLSDSADESAQATGVANVLSLTAAGVTATNTDAPALAEEIAVDCPEPRVAVVLGSGGAAQAAVVACRTLGVERIFVTSRSWQSSVARQQWRRAAVFEALGALTTAWPLAGAVAPPPEAVLDGLLNADVVIQATTAGMLGAGPGQAVSEWLPWARMKPSALAYDLVYNPAVTPFLQEATRAGLCARGGLGMLVRQAALAIRLWLGETPDLTVLRRAAERALAGVGGS